MESYLLLLVLLSSLIAINCDPNYSNFIKQNPPIKVISKIAMNIMEVPTIKVMGNVVRDSIDIVLELGGNLYNFNPLKLDVFNINQFNSFVRTYEKFFKRDYSKDEKGERMSIIKDNIRRIQEHNRKPKTTYKQGVNGMLDMKMTEIQKRKFGFIARKESVTKVKPSQIILRPVPMIISPAVTELTISTTTPDPLTDIPDSWDWRKFGIVTTPRDQGECGCSWSFAAAAVLESHNMKRQIVEGIFDPKKKISVSEQNLIDCSERFETFGCNGGKPEGAFLFVNENKGVMSEVDYPYKAKKENCSYVPEKKVDVFVEKGIRLTKGSDVELVKAIYKFGPVISSLHITANFTAYINGIFEDNECDPNKINHAVVTVGYTKEYFIVKNSWGTIWGEDGYIRISRKKENNCGISQENYYPVIPDATDTDFMKHKLVEIK